MPGELYLDCINRSKKEKEQKFDIEQRIVVVLSKNFTPHELDLIKDYADHWKIFYHAYLKSQEWEDHGSKEKNTRIS
jgi:hypothetical protein